MSYGKVGKEMDCQERVWSRSCFSSTEVAVAPSFRLKVLLQEAPLDLNTLSHKGGFHRSCFADNCGLLYAGQEIE